MKQKSFATYSQKCKLLRLTPSMSWAATWITELPTGMLSLTSASYDLCINSGWLGFLSTTTVTVTPDCLLGTPLSLATTRN